MTIPIAPYTMGSPAQPKVGVLFEVRYINYAGPTAVADCHLLDADGVVIATSYWRTVLTPNDPTALTVLDEPYYGVRLTGEGKVVNGKCTIKLPDYVHGLVKQEGSQVQIANIKHGKVIWVEDIDVKNDQFTLKCDIGTIESNNEYNFYWSFTAIRKDIKDLEVEI